MEYELELMGIERIRWLDISRGIAILLVIMVHTYPQGGVVNSYIQLFIMPLFFCLSGYTYRQKPFVEEVKIDIKRILIPYFIVAIIFISYFLFQKNTIEEFIWSLKRKPFTIIMGASGAITNSEGAPISFFDGVGRVWFLPALFSLKVIFSVINRFTDRIKLVVVLISSIIGYFSPYLPLNFDIALTMLPFFFLGYIHFFDKNVVLNNTSLGKFVLTIICAGVTALCYWQGARLRVDCRMYSRSWLVILASIAGCGMIISLSKLIKSFCIIKLICFIGENSMSIYLIHCVDDVVHWNNFSFLNYIECPVFVIVLIRIIVDCSIVFLGGLSVNKYKKIVLTKTYGRDIC